MVDVDIQLSVVGILVVENAEPRDDVTEWCRKQREESGPSGEHCGTPGSPTTVDDCASPDIRKEKRLFLR